jgi:1-acyl-sn-glycerol-3-phosphate acyltransferase
VDRPHPLPAPAAGPRTRVALPWRAWRAARAALHLAEGLATTLAVFPFVRPARRKALIRHWSRRLLALLDIEPRVAGRIDAHRGNVLIVANHVSWLDIFVLNAHQPARFVAKAELARWPLAGRLIRDAGTIFVTRERRHDTRRVNHHASRALASGDIVAVFPEGTTTDGAGVLRFHASLLQPIVDSEGHVQPVAIRYRDAAGEHSRAPAYGDETFVASFWRVCGEAGLVVELIAADPIPASRAHRRDLARAAEDAIRSALGLPVAGTVPASHGDRAA